MSRLCLSVYRYKRIGYPDCQCGDLSHTDSHFALDRRTYCHRWRWQFRQPSQRSFVGFYLKGFLGDTRHRRENHRMRQFYIRLLVRSFLRDFLSNHSRHKSQRWRECCFLTRGYANEFSLHHSRCQLRYPNRRYCHLGLSWRQLSCHLSLRIEAYTHFLAGIRMPRLSAVLPAVALSREVSHRGCSSSHSPPNSHQHLHSRRPL